MKGSTWRLFDQFQNVFNLRIQRHVLPFIYSLQEFA